MNALSAKPRHPTLAALLLAAPGLAHSAAGNLPESAAGSVLQMLFGLLIVLAALFGTLMLLRRLQSGRTHLIGGLKVLGATNVGPRERVVLLSVGNKVLVLGVTTGHIKRLSTLDAGDIPLSEPAPDPNAAALPDFAQRLRKLMENARAR